MSRCRIFVCPNCNRIIGGCLHDGAEVEYIHSCAWCEHQDRPKKK